MYNHKFLFHFNIFLKRDNATLLLSAQGALRCACVRVMSVCVFVCGDEQGGKSGEGKNKFQKRSINCSAIQLNVCVWLMMI